MSRSVIQVRVSEELLATATNKADAEGRTLSDVIRRHLADWSGERPGQVEIKSPRKATECRASLRGKTLPIGAGDSRSSRDAAPDGESDTHAERPKIPGSKVRRDGGSAKGTRTAEATAPVGNQSGPPQTKSKACSECGAISGHQKWCSKK